MRTFTTRGSSHPSPTSRSNRLAVVFSATALVLSAGFAGGPALARALVTNSDKVDGLHAVKAGASTAQRKGKLVATDAKTGAYKANVIPNSAKYPATVPTGVTLRGAFTTDAESVENAAGDYGSVISYDAKMPAALAVVFLPLGSTSPSCPGTAQQPEANAGFLCVYVTQTAGTDGTFPGVSTPWAYYYDINSATSVGSDVFIRGTWAATAPAPTLKPVTQRLYGPAK